MFYKKVVLKKFAKSKGKQLFQRPFFNKVAGFRFATLLALFKMGWGGRGEGGTPTNFFPVLSTNARLSPQNFPTFNSHPFTTLA